MSNLPQPSAVDAPVIEIYGYRSKHLKVSVYSFSPVSVVNYPGIEVGSPPRFDPNEELAPTKVMVPTGSKVVEDRLEWTLRGAPRDSPATQVIALAMSKQCGFSVVA